MPEPETLLDRLHHGPKEGTWRFLIEEGDGEGNWRLFAHRFTRPA